MKILTIATVTLREAVRRKVHVNLLLFGIFMVLVSYAMSSLTLGYTHRIIADLGLSSMSLAGTLMAVFLGASSIAGDIERRVVYPIAAKPVTRSEYVVGRYLGLCAALILNLVAMAIALAAILVLDAQSFAVLDRTFWAAIAMIGLQFAVVAAIAVFFSSVTSTTLAAIFALSLSLAGQFTNDIKSLWHGGGAWIGQALWYALPNLGALNLNEAVIYRRAVSAGMWIPCAYGVLYASAALAFACVLFERRDFR